MSDNETVKVVGDYRRSLNGEVIHLAPCPRMGRAVRWANADGQSLREVAAFVNRSEWLRLCKSCWPEEAYAFGVGAASGREDQ